MEESLKAVISNRIFLTYSKEVLDNIRGELTYKVPPRKPGGKPEIIKSYSVINKKLITIPVGRIDLIPKNYEIIDKRTQNEAYFPEAVDDFIKALRPSQKEGYNLVNDNYIINAKPGWGKTFTAIAIATKLLQKTLVVVHTVHLRDQWENEVNATLGIEPGIIGSGRYNIDSPIVIANIQSLKNVLDRIRHEFGTVIVDECHHTPASTFRELLDKTTARYKIGLSGTLQRKDGKHVLLFDYISHKVYVPPKENVEDPIVLVYKSDVRIPGNHMMPWANRINSLVKHPGYIKTVQRFAQAQAERGHKVLIVSDRVEFLHKLADEFDDAICITSQVENRHELEAQLKAGTKNKLYGSLGIYKEGISINEISCLVLATAISNEYLMIQLIGRIIRKKKDKMRPEVIDIALAGETGKRQFKTRLRAYRLENYEVKYIN